MIDLSQVEQLMDTSQTRAIALAMYRASLTYMDGSTSMKELVNQVENDIEQNGLDILASKRP